MATNDEVEQLKKFWSADQCWDIEDTEGFEEHREELRAYRIELEAQAKKRVREQREQRAGQAKKELGIVDPVTAQSLYTFAEIERDVCRNAIGEASQFEVSMVELAQAQVRATLLLAAQVKRVADALRC